MFQTSLIEGRRGGDAARVRWIALGSVALQAVVAVGLIVGPLIWPDTLPRDARPPPLTKLELQRRRVVKVEPRKVKTVRVAGAAGMSTPSAPAQMPVESRRGGMLTHAAGAVVSDV